MTTLHERLVAELAHARRARGRDEMVAAVRAVVELHRPVTFWRPYSEPQQCFSCRTDRPGTGTVDWPCSTIRTIAETLGVPIEGDDRGR